MEIEEILEHLVPEPNTGCYLWEMCTSEKGYGKVKFEGKVQKVHRVIWKRANRSIPKKMNILHRCDTPACGNIDHLKIGTVADNNCDMMQKGRHRSGKTIHLALAVRLAKRAARTTCKRFSQTGSTITGKGDAVGRVMVCVQETLFSMRIRLSFGDLRTNPRTRSAARTGRGSGAHSERDGTKPRRGTGQAGQQHAGLLALA